VTGAAPLASSTHPAGVHRVGGRLRRPTRALAAGPMTYALLLAFLLGSAFPLYWSLVVGTQTNDAVGQVPPVLVPGGHLLENLSRVFDESRFAKALLNSVVVAGATAVSVVLSSTLAGFALAKLRFRGRNALLLATVVIMMVPTQLGIVPLYMLMGRLGWTNHLQAVIVPGLVSAFGVFFMRQYLAQAVPTELLEAGRLDGCHTLRLVWHVVAPAARPAAAVLGMFSFIQAWNDFFWPLVVLPPDNPTVQVALSTLASGYTEDYTVVLTGIVLATFPILVVFLALGRYVVRGIADGPRA